MFAHHDNYKFSPITTITTMTNKKLLFVDYDRYDDDEKKCVFFLFVVFLFVIVVTVVTDEQKMFLFVIVVTVVMDGRKNVNSLRKNVIFEKKTKKSLRSVFTSTCHYKVLPRQKKWFPRQKSSSKNPTFLAGGSLEGKLGGGTIIAFAFHFIQITKM